MLSATVENSTVRPPHRTRTERGTVNFNWLGSDCGSGWVYDISLHSPTGSRRFIGEIELCPRRGWLINYVERSPFCARHSFTTYTEALDALFSELDQRQRLANKQL